MTEPNRDLVAFVRARLHEEEQLARAAGGDSWRSTREHPGEVHDPAGGIVFCVRTRSFDEHIAHQDPARTLLRIVASRVILDEYAEVAAKDTDVPGDDYASGRAVGLGFAVRNMAAEHPGHPEYRAAWLPRHSP
jgi:hypothetical protein